LLKKIADKKLEIWIENVTWYIFKSKNLIFFSNCEYWDVTIIDSWDPDSFMYLWNGYSKDKNNVYFVGKRIIQETDTESFHIVQGDDNYDAEDKNHKYFHWTMNKE